MSKLEKPREWWIRINVTAHPAIFECPPSHIINQERPHKGDVVHVIEKSAYDAVVNQLANERKYSDEVRGWYVNTCKERDELLAWKTEALAVMKPILDFKHPEMQLGACKFKTVLKFARERDLYKQDWLLSQGTPGLKSERDALAAQLLSLNIETEHMQKQYVKDAETLDSLRAQLAEAKQMDLTAAVLAKDMEASEKIERLERALAYAKGCVEEEQRFQIEQLERGE